MIPGMPWIPRYRHRLAIEVKVLVGVPYLEIIREVLASGQDLVINRPLRK